MHLKGLLQMPTHRPPCASLLPIFSAPLGRALGESRRFSRKITFRHSGDGNAREWEVRSPMRADQRPVDSHAEEYPDKAVQRVGQAQRRLQAEPGVGEHVHDALPLNRRAKRARWSTPRVRAELQASHEATRTILIHSILSPKRTSFA